MAQYQPENEITIIDSVSRWGFPDFRELFHYRDLIYFMVRRSIRVAYAQSVGGLAWAIVQPALQVLVFSLVFGSLLQLQSDGVPYPLFSAVAVIPWTYMAMVMNVASGSLVSNSRILGKIYFPRLIYLINPAIGGLVEFGISLLIILAVLLYYGQPVSSQIVLLPLVFLLMLATPFSVALWMSSLTIRFRDFQIVMGHLMRALIYFVPVMYSSSEIAPEWRSIYVMNPLVGVIEGYRACLLGSPIYWDSLISSVGITVFLLITGSLYFRRMERIIVDVI